MTGSGLDPDTIADQLPERLPNRPLSVEEAGEIAEAVGASALRETYETESGTVYCPRMFLFIHLGEWTEVAGEREELGTVVVCYIDEQMSEWFGEVENREIRLSQWSKTNELYADEMGTDLDLSKLVATDSETGDIEFERDLTDDGEGST